MPWRYQPVIVQENCFVICECHFDDDGKLMSWTDGGIHPSGEDDISELTSDICMMLTDAYSYVPVKYEDLKVGMIFDKKVTMEQRRALAKFVETIAHNFDQAAKSSTGQ